LADLQQGHWGMANHVFVRIVSKIFMVKTFAINPEGTFSKRMLGLNPFLILAEFIALS